MASPRLTQPQHTVEISVDAGPVLPDDRTGLRVEREDVVVARDDYMRPSLTSGDASKEYCRQRRSP